MPILLPRAARHISYCTHLLLEHVLQTGFGMGMGMNGTADGMYDRPKEPLHIIIIMNIIITIIIIVMYEWHS